MQGHDVITLIICLPWHDYLDKYIAECSTYGNSRDKCWRKGKKEKGKKGEPTDRRRSFVIFIRDLEPLALIMRRKINRQARIVASYNAISSTRTTSETLPPRWPFPHRFSARRLLVVYGA